jgi:antitoxin HigA-1
MRPVSPGEILREQLEELDMSANALATALHVPANRITGILNETRTLTPETALRFERFFAGTTAQFWLNLQTNYDLRKAELESGTGYARSSHSKLERARSAKRWASPQLVATTHSAIFQWAGQGLNLRHPACKASALPLSYPPG